MLKIKECPKCHSKDGYYTKHTYYGSGIFRYSFEKDKPIENGDMHDCLMSKISKYYYCLNCNKRIGIVEEVDD